MSDNPDSVDKGGSVDVLPAGIAITVAPGQPLMRAAQAMGIRWPNICDGQAQCGVCAVEVIDGDLTNTPPSLREKQMLERLPQKARQGGVMRLACQLCPKGPLTVQRLGVRASVRTEGT